MAQSKTSFRLEFYSIAFALKQIRISGVQKYNTIKCEPHLTLMRSVGFVRIISERTFNLV